MALLTLFHVVAWSTPALFRDSDPPKNFLRSREHPSRSKRSR